MNLDAHRDEVVKILKESGGDIAKAMRYLIHNEKCGLKISKDYCDEIALQIKNGEL